MEIVKAGVAGTVESSDILITLEPNASEGVQIRLSSAVEKQFGEQIIRVIEDTLHELGVDQVCVTANDKGALDCVIRSRVQTAAYRAAGSQNFVW